MNQGDIVSKEINDLLVVAQKLSRDSASSGSSLGPERVEELSATVTRTRHLILRLYGKDNLYLEDLSRILSTKYFNRVHSHNYRHVSELAGIIGAIKNDLDSGLLFDLKQKLRAEVFTDFLEMAEYLLNEGYKDASAVLLGAVLEDSLRKLADGNGVSITNTSGRYLTIDPLSVELAKKEVYSPLVKKQITTWANLRNDAAHGHFDKYDSEQVKHMLIFVQKFCADHLT